MTYIKAGSKLIPVSTVYYVDTSDIEKGAVYVDCHSGRFGAYGFDAIEIVMLLKPSALEGKRMRWQRNAWAFHNLVAHPLVQVLSWLGLKKQAIRFHDWTTPRPRDFKKDY